MWSLLKRLWYSEFMYAVWSGLVAGSIGVLMIAAFFFFMEKKEKESMPSQSEQVQVEEPRRPSPAAMDVFNAALRNLRKVRPIERRTLKPGQPADGITAIEPGGDHTLAHEFRRQMWSNYSWRLAVIGLLFHVEQEEAKAFTSHVHDHGHAELAAALTEALRQGLVGVGIQENLDKPMRSYYDEDDVVAIKKISSYARTRGKITIYRLLQEQPNALQW